MAKVKRYEDLIAWQKSMDVVAKVYEVTRQFPKEEMFCLTTQMRRAAISIPSNMAEGWSRKSRKDFLRYLEIALGSCLELQTQMRIATRLGFVKSDNDSMQSDIAEVERITNGLIRSLRTKTD